MIAKIAVSAATFAIDKPYSYHVPEDLALEPGMRVTVPFGRGNRRSEGVVLTLEEGEDRSLKAVERSLDEEPVLSPYGLRLAAVLRERYFCTFYDAIRAMLPGGLWFREQASVALTEDFSWKDAVIKKEGAFEILTHLETLGGRADEQALASVVEDEEVRQSAIQYLLRKKWVRSDADFSRRASDKTEKIATLASSAEEAMEFASRRPKSANLQRAVLELLCSVGSAAVKELCYFTGASTATVNRLEKLGYVQLTERPVLRCREIRPAQLDGPLILSDDQQEVFDALQTRMHSDVPGVALLYGVTGSGKTSVYIKLIEDCLASGRSAMLLVPEIALTPQLLGLMAAHFGQTVAVLHSSLSTGERYDQWKRVRSGEGDLLFHRRIHSHCQPPGKAGLHRSVGAPRASLPGDPPGETGRPPGSEPGSAGRL